MLYPNAPVVTFVITSTQFLFLKAEPFNVVSIVTPLPLPLKTHYCFVHVEILMLNQLFKGNTVDLLIDVSKSIQ